LLYRLTSSALTVSIAKIRIVNTALGLSVIIDIYRIQLGLLCSEA